MECVLLFTLSSLPLTRCYPAIIQYAALPITRLAILHIRASSRDRCRICMPVCTGDAMAVTVRG